MLSLHSHSQFSVAMGSHQHPFSSISMIAQPPAFPHGCPCSCSSSQCSVATMMGQHSSCFYLLLLLLLLLLPHLPSRWLQDSTGDPLLLLRRMQALITHCHCNRVEPSSLLPLSTENSMGSHHHSFFPLRMGMGKKVGAEISLILMEMGVLVRPHCHC